MPKHPDHANSFCQCFGPCELCDAEELAKLRADPVKIEFKSIELPGEMYFNPKAVANLELYGSIADAIESDSVKKEE